MSHPLNIGIYLLPPSEAAGVERAAWAEQQGFSSVWVPDGEGKMHALTLAGALTVLTKRIRIGIGIVPVFSHSPATLASSALALSHLAPGRIAMGLGASSEGMMEGWHGIPYAKPLTRVKETTQVLRRMLDGERVEFDGETIHTRGFRLNPTPSERVPIYLAALRPKMAELAGEVADGAILHLVPLNLLPKLLEHVAAGAKRAGRTLADLDIVCRFNTVVADDRDAAMEEARTFVQRYFTAPVYSRYFEWCGFAEEAARFTEGFKSKDREATRAAITDRVVETLCIVGDAESCREQIRAFHAAGINTPVIQALSTDPATALRTWEAFFPGHFGG